MRVVAEIPHTHFKITVFSWNAKYQVKIEIDGFEQVYKISEQDVNGLDDVKLMLSDEFLTSCMKRFLTMREDFGKSFKNIYTDGK